jgi:hypothetical protein
MNCDWCQAQATTFVKFIDNNEEYSVVFSACGTHRDRIPWIVNNDPYYQIIISEEEAELIGIHEVMDS